MLTTNLSLLLPKTQFESFETNRLEFCNQYARLRFGYETTDGHVPDTVLCADCRSATEVGQRVELIKVELSVFIFGGYYVKDDPDPIFEKSEFGVYDQSNDCRNWVYSKDDAYQYIFNKIVPRLFDFDIEKYTLEPTPEIEKYILRGWNMDNVEKDGNPEWVNDFAIQFPIEVYTTGEMGGFKWGSPIVKIKTHRPDDYFAVSYFDYTKL